LDPVSIESDIEAVTVYSSGAQVRRVGRLEANGGFPERIRVPGLPLCLDDTSVRVWLEPPAEGDPVPTVADVRVGLLAAAPADVREPPDEADLEALRLEAARLRRRLDVVRGEAARLRSLKPPPESPADLRLALLAFRTGREERLVEKRIETADRLREVTERTRELEEQRRLASQAGVVREGDLSKSAEVRLAAPAGASCGARLIVEYLVPGARWAPGYSLRVDEDLERARLSLRAMVCQDTGEDWEGVRLTLSTANPSSWRELPELCSLRIGRRQRPPSKLGWREPPTGAEALYADYDGFRERFLPAPDLFDEPTRRYAPPALPAEEPQDWDRTAESLDEIEDAYDEEYEEADEPDGVAELSAYAPSEPSPMPLACAAPAPPPAPGRALPKKARARSAAPRAPASPAMAPPAPEPPPPPSAPDALLDYGRLRLGDACSPDRGALRRVPSGEVWLELLAHLEVEVELDVVAVVRRAADRSAAVAHRPPPTGHRAPARTDGFDSVYRTSAVVDVPADRGFVSVPVLAADTSVAMRHVVVPRESTDAFRMARVTNPLEVALLPGPTDVYLGAELLLTPPLEAVAPGGHCELGLGVDEALKVARNSHFEEEAAGLLRGRLALKHGIEIELANNGASAARVEVRERVPVRREEDDDVEVEVGPAEPAWEEWEPEPEPHAARLRGGYRWRVDLPAGAKQRLEAQYTVSIASKHELVGGNRREGGA